MRERVTIDLAKFTTPDVRCFIGRDRGSAIREACGVTDGTPVRLVVPMNTFGLTHGFVVELLRGVTDMEYDGPAHLGLSIVEYLDTARRSRAFHDALSRATPWPAPAVPSPERAPAEGAE